MKKEKANKGMKYQPKLKMDGTFEEVMAKLFDDTPNKNSDVIQRGDLVCLKSNPKQRMIVKSTDKEKSTCRWFNELDNLHVENFDNNLLSIIKSYELNRT